MKNDIPRFLRLLAVTATSLHGACGGPVGEAATGHAAAQPGPTRPAPVSTSAAPLPTATPSGQGPDAPAPPGAFATGALAITSVTVGGYGQIVTLHDGRTLMVMHPHEWPTAIVDVPRAGAPSLPACDVHAPCARALLSALRELRAGPSIEAPALASAIRWLERGPIVMHPDWSDVVITRVEQTGPKHHEVAFTKRGVALTATVARSSTHLDYTGGYVHASSATIELRGFGAQLVEPLRQARLAPGVSPAARDRVVALLAEPPRQTTGPNEP